MRLIAPTLLTNKEVESMSIHIMANAPVLGVRQSHRRTHISYKELMAWEASGALIDWIDQYRTRIYQARDTSPPKRHYKKKEVVRPSVPSWSPSPSEEHQEIAANKNEFRAPVHHEHHENHGRNETIDEASRSDVTIFPELFERLVPNSNTNP